MLSIMKRYGGRFIFLLAVLLSYACSSEIIATLPPSNISTNTPDVCSVEFLPGEVEKIHKFMREFDDASLIATNAPRDHLPTIISEMQRIRRSAGYHVVPPCLADLKQIQLAHMNTVIETMVAFLGGADPEILSQGILLSRQQHNQYAIEYARLLGLTVVVRATETPVVLATDVPTQTVVSAYQAVNSGTEDVELHLEPFEDAPVVAILVAGGSIPVFSQSEDGIWLGVELPGTPSQIAWIQTSKVTLVPLP